MKKIIFCFIILGILIACSSISYAKVTFLGPNISKDGYYVYINRTYISLDDLDNLDILKNARKYTQKGNYSFIQEIIDSVNCNFDQLTLCAERGKYIVYIYNSLDQIEKIAIGEMCYKFICKNTTYIINNDEKCKDDEEELCLEYNSTPKCITFENGSGSCSGDCIKKVCHYSKKTISNMVHQIQTSYSRREYQVEYLKKTVYPVIHHDNGQRDVVNGKYVYYINDTTQKSKKRNEPCLKNYECESTICLDNKCYRDTNEIYVRGDGIVLYYPDIDKSNTKEASIEISNDLRNTYVFNGSRYTLKKDEQACQENYECKSNVCFDNKCYNIKKSIENIDKQDKQEDIINKTENLSKNIENLSETIKQQEKDIKKVSENVKNLTQEVKEQRSLIQKIIIWIKSLLGFEDI